MKRVIVDRYGGPDVVRIEDTDVPVPGEGEVRVRVLASGVSITDVQILAGTYPGGPKPPFTPGYELVGVVDELGPGCTRLRLGDRVGALTEWGANAEMTCIPEKYAVKAPDDLDPAVVLNLVFTYMTAYQLLHRAAKAESGESVLLHGAAGRVGTAVLELAKAAGIRAYGTASAKDRAAVETARRRGHRLPQRGFPHPSARADRRGSRRLRPGGRLVLYGAHGTIEGGRQGQARPVRIPRGDTAGAARGRAPPATTGARLPRPETAYPPPGLVPAALRPHARTPPHRRYRSPCRGTHSGSSQLRV